MSAIVLLTPSEAAAYLSVSLRGLRRLTKERRLPYRRVGRQLRFHPVELDTWTQQHRQPDAARLRVVSRG